jgi:hypothetical protein
VVTHALHGRETRRELIPNSETDQGNIRLLASDRFKEATGIRTRKHLEAGMTFQHTRQQFTAHGSCICDNYPAAINSKKNS